MAETSEISWTDATFNPWIGCTKVSLGCDHCYAKADFDDRKHRVIWGAGQARSRTAPANWKKPLQWNKRPYYACIDCAWRGDEPARPNLAGGATLDLCPACGGDIGPARRRVFCASLADVFDNEVDPQWRLDLFKLIAATPNLDWLLLTKRIGNVKAMLPSNTSNEPAADFAQLWPNAWLGATIVNQEEADRDIPKLLATPARVRFLSMEPLLGPVDLTRIPVSGHGHHEFDPIITANVLKRATEYPPLPQVHWVIVGGESGHGARPMHPDWARGLRDQCAAARVPFHFKQWGEWAPRNEWGYHRIGQQCAIKLDGAPVSHDDAPQDVGGHRFERVGKKAAGRLLDGVTHDAFPKATPA